MVASLTQILAHQPRVADALTTARSVAMAQNDPALLALADLRISELLGAVSPPSTNDAVAELRATPLGEAVVAFVEQWVVDVAAVTDDMISSLCDHLGEDRLMDFIHGVLTVEQRIRLELAWDRLGL